MILLLNAGMLLALAAGGQRVMPFTTDIPVEMPSLSRWSKASGRAPVEGGAAFLQYELYYQPSRAYYEVIRYRVTGWDGDVSGAYNSDERLQWQEEVKTLRRYVCEPQAGGACRWREFDRKGAEYTRELQVIMWVLNLHRRLLYEREGNPQ